MRIPVYAGMSSNGNFTYEYIDNNKEEIRILRYNGKQSILTIPTTINGKKVVEIGEQAFYGNETLEQIFFKGTALKTVKEGAFYSCTNLKNVDFSKSLVEVVEDDAFNQCKELVQVCFPNTLKKIGERAFSECISLENVLVGNGLKSIGQMAFYGCTSMKQIVLPDGMEHLGSIDGTISYGGVFYGCSSLQEISIGKGLTEILANTFYGCTNLKKVKLPDSVTEIGGRAFAYCSNLKEITFSVNLQKIKTGAFYNCENLKTLVFPDSLEEIESGKYGLESTFNKCIRLKKVVFGKNLKKIGAYAFRGCNALKEIVLPEGMSVLEEGVFGNCSRLSAIYCLGNVPKIIHGAIEHCDEHLKIYYLPGFSAGIGSYKSEPYQKQSAFYTVTFLDRETGEVLDSSFARKGEQVAAPVIPKKNGYSFAGWLEQETGKIWEFSTDQVSQDRNLIALWDLKEYQITYDSTGGVLTEKDTKVVTYKSKIGKLPTPTKKDYKFVGWYTKENGGKRYKETSIMPAKNFTLYAKWQLYPAKPKATKLKANILAPTEIRLLWNKISTADGYDIYRSTSENGTYRKIASASAKATGYVNLGLTAGKTYYYRVRTYRILENQKFYGAYSNKVKIKLTGKPAKTVLTVKRKNKNTVDLSWENVKGADGYTVYCRMSKDKEMKPFATFESNVKGCYHTKLKEQKTYYYSARAYKIVDGKKVYGAMSDIKSIFLARK